MDSEREYHKHDYFNFYPACGTSINRQTENCDLKQSEQQNTPFKHTGETENTAQHPGTQKYNPKYPGTNQHFSQHPGTNPFSTQEIRTTHHLAQYPGANQHSTKHPGLAQSSTPLLGQFPFGVATHYTGTGKFPGPPLFSPYLGSAQHPRTSKEFVGNMPYNTVSQFQQTAAQFSDGTKCTRENPSRQQVVGNIATSTISNFNSKVFGNTTAQPQDFNADQFTSLNVDERQLDGPQNVSF